MALKKKYLIIAVIGIIILALFLFLNLANKGDKKIKYKILEAPEIPDKIKEILPKYLAKERALTLKLNEEIYVLVTRGEKQTEGYTVDIEKLVLEGKAKEGLGLVVYAIYKDPDPNDIVAQSFSYPFIIVKTNLKDMPENVSLEIIYEE